MIPDTSPPVLKSISDCSRQLDFSPLSPWPESLPGIAITGWVLAGFDRPIVLDYEIDLNQADKIVEFFKGLYPELSFAELSRLVFQCDSAKIQWLPKKILFQAYGLNWNDHTMKISQNLSQLPIHFQNWCGLKKVGAQELCPLLAAQSIPVNVLCHQIVHRQLSRALGIRALELGIELLLMEQNIDELLSANCNADEWVEQLALRRFPEQSRRDSEAQQLIKKYPWPGSSQIRWTRQGDRAGIEMKLFVSQPSDLKKFSENLNRLQDLLEKDPDNPWTHH